MAKRVPASNKPTSVLGRFGRQLRVLALHDSTQVVKRCKTLRCKTVHPEKRLACAQIMYARSLSSTGKTRVRQKMQPLRLDKIVFSAEKMFRFGESGLSAQNCRVHTKVHRKRDLKPSMVALEGGKFMKASSLLLVPHWTVGSGSRISCLPL